MFLSASPAWFSKFSFFYISLLCRRWTFIKSPWQYRIRKVWAESSCNKKSRFSNVRAQGWKGTVLLRWRPIHAYPSTARKTLIIIIWGRSLVTTLNVWMLNVERWTLIKTMPGPAVPRCYVGKNHYTRDLGGLFQIKQDIGASKEIRFSGKDDTGRWHHWQGRVQW